MKRAAYDVSTTANLEGGYMDCLVPGRQNERRKPRKQSFVSLKFLTKNVTKNYFIWKWLYIGSVPMNSVHLVGSVPMNSVHLIGTLYI